ncbi:MAG: hypothetical protein M5U29_03780 [Anaerolineae bacterium]|nr:hypothetical protein [Anaerolineae bacterium]
MPGCEARPVTPLDLGLVRRLIAQRLPLDVACALARGLPGMEGVLLSSVPLADLGAPTVVMRNGDGGLVGQVRQRPGRGVARMTFLAPEPQAAHLSCWMQIIEALVVEAGKRGAMLVSAEVPEDHAVFAAFRQTGFAVYSRQTILRREPGRAAGNPALLRPETEADAIAISTLHANTVPRLLQQAEPLPEPDHSGLIYEKDGHIAAYLLVIEGKNGVVIKPYFHPEVYDQTAAVILAALAHIPRAGQVPVFLYARAYQDWLRGVLEQAGFTPWTEHALLVKHTMHRVERLEPLTVPGLEAGRLRPPVVDGPLTRLSRPKSLFGRWSHGRHNGNHR